MAEKDIERFLVNEVKKMGGTAYKFVSPGNDGVPDRIIIIPGGGIIFVELKSETGRLSALQTRQIKRINSLGQQAIVLKGMDEARRFVVALRAECRKHEAKRELIGRLTQEAIRA